MIGSLNLSRLWRRPQYTDTKPNSTRQSTQLRVCRSRLLISSGPREQNGRCTFPSLFLFHFIFPIPQIYPASASAAIRAEMSDSQSSLKGPSPAVNQDAVLSADELELRAQGHKGELPRQFSTLSTLSIAFLLTSAWIGYSAVFPYPLLAGSVPYVFWGLIVAMVACTFISKI